MCRIETALLHIRLYTHFVDINAELDEASELNEYEGYFNLANSIHRIDDAASKINRLRSKL